MWVVQRVDVTHPAFAVTPGLPQTRDPTRSLICGFAPRPGSGGLKCIDVGRGYLSPLRYGCRGSASVTDGSAVLGRPPGRVDTLPTVRARNSPAVGSSGRTRQ
jgi:hypothetical protein